MHENLKTQFDEYVAALGPSRRMQVEQECGLIPGLGGRRVDTPGMPGLSVVCSALHGLCTEGIGDAPDLWYSVLDFFIPDSNLHLVAFSDQSPKETDRSCHFQLMTIRNPASTRKSDTHLVWGGLKAKRRYRPARAEQMCADEEMIDPWICFTVETDRIIHDHKLQRYPLMHSPDLRRCVDDPRRHVVVLEDSTFIELWHTRPWKGDQSAQALLAQIARERGCREFGGSLWGRLNNTSIIFKDYDTVLGPYRAVVDQGRIRALRRQCFDREGYVQATGVYEPVESSMLPIGSTDALVRELKTRMAATNITRECADDTKTMSLLAEYELDRAGPSLRITVCADRLREFLLWCARQHAAAPEKWPNHPYREVMEVTHAFSPKSYERCLATMSRIPRSIRESLIRILPPDVRIPWIATYEDIAEEHDVSVRTVRRTAHKLGIAIPGVRPPCIYAADYRRHRAKFSRKSTTSEF